MPNYTIYETASGRPVSHTTVLPEVEKLPAVIEFRKTTPYDPENPATFLTLEQALALKGHSLKTHPAKPGINQMWDDATKAFIDIPAPVLVDQLAEIKKKSKVDAVFKKLDAADAKVIEDEMILLMGTKRYKEAP